MRGLSACGRIILPAVFPFLAVSVFLAGRPGGAGLAALLSGVMRYCFRLPAAAAPALLMSWIGGYPAGAKTLAELAAAGGPYRAGNGGSGPGADLQRAGLYGRGGGRPHFRLHGGGDFFVPVPAGGGSAAGAAVCLGPAAAAQREPLAVFSQNGAGRGAAGTVGGFGGFLGGEYLRLCGAAFGLCGSIFRLRAVPPAGEGGGFSHARGNSRRGGPLLFYRPFEICAGSALAAELPPTEAGKILPFLLSFGGLSVCCQVSACFGEEPLPWGKLLWGRLLHGLFTAFLAVPWLKRVVLPAMTGAAVPAFSVGRMLWGSGAMVLLCLLLTVRWERGMAAEG